MAAITEPNWCVLPRVAACCRLSRLVAACFSVLTHARTQILRVDEDNARGGIPQGRVSLFWPRGSDQKGYIMATTPFAEQQRMMAEPQHTAPVVLFTF